MKKIAALFLVLVLCAGMMPASAFSDREFEPEPDHFEMPLERGPEDSVFDLEEAYAYYLTLDQEEAKRYLASLSEEDLNRLLDYVDMMNEIALAEAELQAELAQAEEEAEAELARAQEEAEAELACAEEEAEVELAQASEKSEAEVSPVEGETELSLEESETPEESAEEQPEETEATESETTETESEAESGDAETTETESETESEETGTEESTGTESTDDSTQTTESGTEDTAEGQEAAETAEQTDQKELQAGDPSDGKDDTQPEIKIITGVCINPIYADVIDPSDFPEPEVTEEDYNRFRTLLGLTDGSYANGTTEAEYTSVEDAAAAVRSGLVAREASIAITLSTGETTTAELVDDYCDEIFSKAKLHTGKATEGDYIRWQYGSVTKKSSYYEGGTIFIFTYEVTYYTTADQEAVMTSTVNSVLSSLNLGSKTPYQKIEAIYSYLCKNVTYDNANLNDDTYLLKYTGYAALVNGTAVCQGYSVAFYRLCLEAGIDARIVTSTTMCHAWNIVSFSGSYYELDATWDAGYTYYSYFLKGSTSWLTNHTYKSYSSIGDEFSDAGFAATYSLPKTDVYCLTNDNGIEKRDTCFGYIVLEDEACGAGKTVTVTAYPDEGFVLKGLYYNDGTTEYEITGGSFVMPESDVTVYATFSAYTSYLTVSSKLIAYLNGLPIEADENSKIYATDYDSGTMITLVSYSTGAMDGTDYPTALVIYRVDDGGRFIPVEALGDLLCYNGTSIRCTEPYGLRVEYGIPLSEYSDLTGTHACGYVLQEFGTVAVWTSTGTVPVLGCTGCMTAYAYRSSEGYNDTTLADTDAYHRYTNALTFSNYERVKPELSIRPYCILKDTSTGTETVLYGGITVRSISSVASQNLVDPDGLSSAEITFLQGIYDYAYGTAA